MSKFLLAIATIISAILLNVSSSYACRCKDPANTGIAYKKADLVIQGTVQKLTGSIKTPEGSVAEIAVDNAWKGKTSGLIKVVNQRSCAYDFKAGQSYLVFLHRVPNQKIYLTYTCSGNLAISKANKSLKWLKVHGKPVSISH